MGTFCLLNAKYFFFIYCHRKNYHNHEQADGIESVCLDCQDEDTTLKGMCKIYNRSSFYFLLKLN